MTGRAVHARTLLPVVAHSFSTRRSPTCRLGTVVRPLETMHERANVAGGLQLSGDGPQRVAGLHHVDRGLRVRVQERRQERSRTRTRPGGRDTWPRGHGDDGEGQCRAAPSRAGGPRISDIWLESIRRRSSCRPVSRSRRSYRRDRQCCSHTNLPPGPLWSRLGSPIERTFAISARTPVRRQPENERLFPNGCLTRRANISTFSP